MDIKVAPYTFEPSCDCSPEVVGFDKNIHICDIHAPITYWGVFLNENRVSMTSSRELAEKTREWMEDWLVKTQ
ncbi:MAG: hypothetical protein ACHQ6U_10390 [Thermodesulfobacteriota bacterium]